MRLLVYLVPVLLLPVRAAGAPADLGLDPVRLARLDTIVPAGLREGKTPGAVVLVVRQDEVAFSKAYGTLTSEPGAPPLPADAVFDLASLTKPIACATAIMLLVEQGKLRLSDPVSRHLPPFTARGKEAITIEQLLLHTSGLPAGSPVADYTAGREAAVKKIAALPLLAEPGARFTYSDLGYILLGEVVGKVSGQPLDAFCREQLWRPLGMNSTDFRPDPALAKRTVPSQRTEGRMLQGEVHDPRARALGGVAGHAGLFSTAGDLARYAGMVLRGGELDGKRVLAPATVKLMTAPRPVPGGQRALGWDVRTSYSSNRGELFGGFGHTGFTGTSIWIDPDARTAVVFLSHRVHPDGKGNVVRLRGQVSTAVAASIVRAPFPGGAASAPDAPGVRPVLNGIDVLKRDAFALLKGKKVGLVTNHTGRDREGNSTIDLLHTAKDVKLTALFSPEHGIRGALDAPVPDGKDAKTGLPVYSLYGERRRPAPEQLKGLDVLVYDIQDIGCRFYTYSTTLGYILETAAAHKLRAVVLDRPNPIAGVAVEGPVRDAGKDTFVAYHRLPLRHGLTVGELAMLFNRERKINAELVVVRVEGWRRADLFDRTGLEWTNPSPNMRSLAAALLYPGIGLLETTNVSVGRGTDRPFELIGAPWMDGRKLAEALTRANLPGVRFVPARFTPASSTHAKKECGGVQIYLDDWRRFESLPVGMAVARELRRLHPKDWNTARYNVLLGHEATWKAIEAGTPAGKVVRSWSKELEAFAAVRRRYLLYPE